MNLLETYLNEKWLLTAQESNSIATFFEPLEVETNHHLLVENEKCDYLYFAPPTSILSFNIKIKGKLRTKFFTVGPYLFTSSSSLSSRTLSKEIIIAHSDSILYRLHIDVHQNLLKTMPYWNELIRKLLIEVQLLTEEILLAASEQSPKERFLKLLDEQPIVIQKVPQKMIASFLGIAPESLSRIKKNILISRKR